MELSKKAGGAGSLGSSAQIVTHMTMATRLCILFLTTLTISGCAGGSARVIGETKPALEDWTSVIVLTEMPEGAEQIAIVKASSVIRRSAQKSLDDAVDKLKRQAAKVGANVVVLVSQSRSSLSSASRGVETGTGFGATEAQNVEGVAVYLPANPH